MTVTNPIELGQPILDVKKPEDDDQRFWSVTTIIGVLDKPALLYWASEQAATCAVKNLDSWQAIEASDGTDEAIKYIANARFRPPKGERTAAQLGTEVHAACEALALTGKVPEVDDEVRPFVEQFDRWLQRHSPVYQAAEVTVYSPQYGYAGTCDGFFTIDGTRLIFDLKSSKKATNKKGEATPVYPEIALQLAAYRYAEVAAVWRPRRFESFRRRYYLLSQQERDQAVAVPEVDGGLGIKITPSSCVAYPVRCDEPVYDAYLYALEVARWQFELSKTVIGEPLTVED